MPPPPPHPKSNPADDVPRMREIVLDQSMEDMDKNRNGFLSIDEYIG